MNPKVTKSGGEDSDSRMDFTVVFSNMQLLEADMSALTKDARSLFDEVAITDDVERTIHLFVKNGATVALIHYVISFGVGADDARRCERDCKAVIEHISALLQVYGGEH
jgi:hypothetical protein